MPLWYTDRYDEARRLWQELLEIKPDFSVKHFEQNLPYQDPATFGWFVDGLRQAGIVIER